MPRLFTAVAMPPDVQAQLGDLQRGAPGVQWQKKENFHLTLNFIGEVNEKLVRALEDVLATVRATEPFQLTCQGVGYFGRPEAPTVLWAGVEPIDPLEALQQRLAEALISHGFRPDARQFHPHITLGRHAPEAADAEQWLTRHSDFQSQPLTVDRIVLFESRSENGALRYLPLTSVRLGSSASPGTVEWPDQSLP